MSEDREGRSSDITFLHRVSRIVTSALSLDEMLGQIVGLTAQSTGCDACLIYLVESSTGEFVLRASQVPRTQDLGDVRVKPGEGVTGWVAEHQSVGRPRLPGFGRSAFQEGRGAGGGHL